MAIQTSSVMLLVDGCASLGYIIIKKANGRDLGDIWYELSEKERIKVVVQVARVESVLFSISLSGCGSVYYKRDLKMASKL